MRDAGALLSNLPAPLVFVSSNLNPHPPGNCRDWRNLHASEL
jgi:hypothetical protein